MATAKTYIVGTNGNAKRLDDLTLPWTDIALTSSYPQLNEHNMYDVMTDPNDQDKVFVVGTGSSNQFVFGIYVSTDGGATWLIPSGTYQTNLIGTSLSLKWNEVWVIDSNNIVVAGDSGYIARSTDAGSSFNLSTQLPLLPPSVGGTPVIPDVESIHFLTPSVGVVGLKAHVALTINGGTTWTILNGGNIIVGGTSGALDRCSGIHVSADQQTIVALASNAIFRSTDGGVSFTEVYPFPARNGRHLTWINDNELWAFGSNGEIAKTTDAGATWTTLFAYSPGAENHFAGHFYQNQNGFYSGSLNLYSTNDGALSGALSIAESYPIQAVWTWIGQPPVQTYQLTSCDGSVPPILVTNDLSQSVGQIIQVCPSDIPPNVGTAVGTPIPIDPSDTGITAYELRDCCGLLPDTVVMNNMSPYGTGTVVIPALSPTTCWRVRKGDASHPNNVGLVDLTGGLFYSFAIGQQICEPCLANFPCEPIVNLPGCTCFQISLGSGTSGAITLLNVGPITPTCEECIGFTNRCYYLIDCTNPDNYINTTVDLSQYVGQIIKLQDCPDTCWTVYESFDCMGAVCISDVIESYPDCQSCLPPVPEPEPVSLNHRAVNPGFYTPGCPPEYTTNVNCTFAEGIYQQMVSKRYGITICCDIDTQKWLIKKQLLDLKALYDPELCNCSLSSCCPPSCVDAVLQVFNPRTCPPPSNVTVQLDVDVLFCPAPGPILSSGIDIPIT